MADSSDKRMDVESSEDEDSDVCENLSGEDEDSDMRENLSGESEMCENSSGEDEDSDMCENSSGEDEESDQADGCEKNALTLSTATSPKEDDGDMTTGKLMECKQSRCTGGYVNVKFIFRPSYTSDIAQMVDAAGTSGDIEILLPRSVRAEKYEINTPLHWACEKGYIDVINILLDHGACVHSGNYGASMTPFHVASDNGQLEAIKLLLAREPSDCLGDENDTFGKLIRTYDKYGNTGLHFACRKGHFDAANELLARGAEVDSGNRYEQLPLHLACGSGNAELVKLLISKDPDTVWLVDEFEATPMHYACEERGNVEILTALVSSGASVNDVDVGRIAPIHTASQFGHVDCVEYLLSQGADVNVRDNFEQTPLHCASHRDKVAVADFLLANGAAVDAADNLRKTPLHWASERGYLTMVKLLLANGANCNLKDKSDKIPITCIRDDTYGLLFLQGSHLPVHRCSMFEDAYELSDDTCISVTRALLLHGSDVNEVIVGDTCTQILIDYQVGSSGSVIKPDVLPAIPTMRGLKSMKPDNDVEKCYLKTVVASIGAEGEALPGRKSVYWARCETELKKMKTDTISNTTATYYDLLSRNLAALRDQNIVGNFSPDLCVTTYPIYGDTICCSYVRLRRFFLVNQTAAFFYLTQPNLLPECAERIQAYLTDKDLGNLLNICQSHQAVAEDQSDDDQSDDPIDNKRSRLELPL